MTELEQAIGRMVGKGAKRVQVKQVLAGLATEITDTTCTVIREGSAPLYGVRLNAIDDNLKSYATVYPADKSNVLVAIIENTQMEAVVISCSEVERVMIKIGEQMLLMDKDGVVFNDGTNGGLTNTPELKKQLDKLTARVDGIISALENATGVTAGDGGKTLQGQIVLGLNMITQKENFNEIEDKLVTH